MELREQQYLVNLVQGDKKSFAALYELYHAKVYCYCFRFVRNMEVAQEITSDVFVKLWEKRKTIDVNRPLGGLLFKISKDFCLDYLRKVSRDRRRRNIFIEQYLESSLNTLEDQLFFDEGMKIAQKAIESLPPRCKEVFHLRYFSGLTLLQISEELEISPNTVQNHLQKGNRQVRAYLRSHTDLVLGCLLIWVM